MQPSSCQSPSGGSPRPTFSEEQCLCCGHPGGRSVRAAVSFNLESDHDTAPNLGGLLKSPQLCFSFEKLINQAVFEIIKASYLNFCHPYLRVNFLKSYIC
jgi:hypothetical protein